MKKVISYSANGKIVLKMESKGLGDSIEKFIKIIGVKKIVNSITDDCGCDERKEKLNKKFPYKNDN